MDRRAGCVEQALYMQNSQHPTGVALSCPQIRLKVSRYIRQSLLVSPTWLTTMWAPEACWRPRMVSPPRPMMRPTMPGGHSTVSDTSPWPGAPTSATRVVIWATACCTRSGEGPVTVTFLLSPGVVWSICTDSAQTGSDVCVLQPKLCTTHAVLAVEADHTCPAFTACITTS